MKFLFFLLPFFLGCALFAPFTLDELAMTDAQSVIITNRNTVEQTSKLSNKKHIVISIGNPGKTPVWIAENQNLVDVLYIQFADSDGADGITNQQAKKIADFYLKNKDIPVVIVQCEAGICRSAAVAAAIMQYSTGTNRKIFDNPKFSPRMRVYNKVLTALN